MRILTAEQIRQADSYTIEHEPIKSIDLMERAAKKCAGSILSLMGMDVSVPSVDDPFVVLICGMGNNGGDGLVIARLLAKETVKVKVYVAKYAKKGSSDFETNLIRAKDADVDLVELSEGEKMPDLSGTDLIIDALFGSGLARPVEGWLAGLIEMMNSSMARIISVDMPSGLFTEDNRSNNGRVVHADHTLTFEVPKLAQLLAENYKCVGEWHVLPIGLDKGFISGLPSQYELIDVEMIASLLHPRSKIAHKGNFGHALIVAGSKGKMGAAVLALSACVRSGAGLISGHIPAEGLDIVQISTPETMCSIDPDPDKFSTVPELTPYTTVGVGPGLGVDPQSANALKLLVQNSSRPMVLDADALNILAENRTWLAFLPKGSVLTPHPKEFERIVGPCISDLDRLEAAIELAEKNSLIVVLKGAYTAICNPVGKVYFNATGNPGMATGGSGDVLTGIITGLLAQGYAPQEAAILGVYWHGVAGDKAAELHGEASLKASDIIENMGKAYLAFKKGSPGFLRHS